MSNSNMLVSWLRLFLLTLPDALKNLLEEDELDKRAEAEADKKEVTLKEYLESKKEVSNEPSQG